MGQKMEWIVDSAENVYSFYFVDENLILKSKKKKILKQDTFSFALYSYCQNTTPFSSTPS